MSTVPSTTSDAIPSENLISFRLNRDGVTSMHWAASMLAAITAGVHGYLYAETGSIAFLVAALGFLLGIGLLFAVERRTRVYVYALGVPFVLAQVGLWVAAGGPFFLLGLFDKVVQLVFVYALVTLVRVDLKAEAKHRATVARRAARTAQTAAGEAVDHAAR